MPSNTPNPPRPNSLWSDLRFDAPASIAVALVALPLCLGIAVASNAPPIAGVLSGIVGGILVGALSGSHTSVSGPAAGLTAVVIAAIASLDGSFETFLIAVVLAGVIQCAMGLARAGFVAAYFPTAVIRGLLAAIGLILIFKQIPHALGIDSDPEGDFSFQQPDHENTFSELLHMFSRIHPGAVVISAVGLAVILLWDRTPLKKLPLPSSLVAVALGIAINLVLLAVQPSWGLGGNHLVQLPDFNGVGELGKLLTFPDWSQLFSEHTSELLFIAVELAIVASLETLLNIEAIDKLDPRKRHSPPDRELLAQGVGNITAGMLGGLPVTSVVVRSSMNVNSGGVSKKSAILHGFILLGSVALVPHVLNMIPLAALAAVLLVTGYKLASLKVFRDFFQRGWSQFLPFLATVVAIMFTDLLIGICIGMGVGIFFILRSNSQSPVTSHEESHPVGDVLRLKFAQQVTFLNRARLRATLSGIPNGAQLVLDASDTDYLDQDILQELRTFRDEEAPVRDIQVNMIGFREKYYLENHVEYINVLTHETQQKLRPEKVLQILKEGNQRFAEGKRTNHGLLRQVSLTSGTQHPMAAVLGCIDSRTTSELIFDLGLGDVFSVRVAGNVVNNDVLGSLEYATKVAGAKLIVVMGHTNCGAINAACDSIQLGHVTGLLSKIQSAIDLEQVTAQDRTANNPRFVSNVTRLNVLLSVESILEESETIRKMVEDGDIAIVGAIYDIKTGTIDFYGDIPETVEKSELLAAEPA